METQNDKQQLVKVANNTNVKGSQVLLRIIAFLLTLLSTILVAVDKQTKIVQVEIAPSVPLDIPATAKFHYISAFVFFVVANALACSYAAGSLLLLLAGITGKKGLPFLIIVLDLAGVALLFSGIGAAAAVGVLGKYGNTHVNWKKVCDIFDKFCNQLAAAVMLSLLGSLAFFFLVLIAAFNLHKKNK